MIRKTLKIAAIAMFMLASQPLINRPSYVNKEIKDIRLKGTLHYASDDGTYGKLERDLRKDMPQAYYLMSGEDIYYVAAIPSLNGKIEERYASLSLMPYESLDDSIKLKFSSFSKTPIGLIKPGSIDYISHNQE